MGQEVRVSADYAGTQLVQSATIANKDGVPVGITRIIDGDILPSRVTITIGTDRVLIDSGNARGISASNLAIATFNGKPISRELAVQIAEASSVLSDYKYNTAEADRMTSAVHGREAMRISARQP